LSVKEFCATRGNFLSRDLCESRECRKPGNRETPFCRQLQEREARNQTPQGD
jgi:hypothetical protein